MTQHVLELPIAQTVLDPASARAAAIVTASFADSRRPEISPFHRRIASAEFRDDGTVWATVEMFDGRPALVECIPYGKPEGGMTTWRHRWKEMPGGDCSYECDGWRRVKDFTV